MESILFSISGPVATVTLNRPDKLNAFGGTMREELLAALEAVAENSAVRAVIVTGAGRAFCAGGDVKAMGETRARGDEGRFQELLEFGRKVVTRLRTLPQPSIAAVNGVAAGAGFSLALACDMRVAAKDARFIASFGKLGLHPDWGMTYTLPRLVGTAKALEIVLTAEPIPAEEAHSLGLVNRVVDPEKLLEAAEGLANTIAARSPRTTALVRQTFIHSHDSRFEAVFDAEIAAQLECFRSEDLVEGIRAFGEKRDPVFRDR